MPASHTGLSIFWTAGSFPEYSSLKIFIIMIVTNYWNCAWRSLTKKKGFSVVNIVGLAIGMAAALLILTYVAFEYSYDDMHSRQDRIFRVEPRVL